MRTRKKMTFETWMITVNDLVESMVYVSTEDLPDCCYRDWFDEGITPLQAARRAIKRVNSSNEWSR